MTAYFRKLANDLPMLESKDEFPDLRKYILDTSAKYCEEHKTENKPLPDISKKTGMAYWLAKDCVDKTSAETRAKIAQELASHGLNIAGSNCLSKKNKHHPKTSKEDGYNAISKYKFYLAFENSEHCKEYVTEKLWYNSFYCGTVPIVWGATKEDYSRLAPPNSFILYEDYKNPQDLIDYLKYLDMNDTAYMEYFEWRKMFPCNYPLYKEDDKEEFKYAIVAKFSFLTAYCSICKILRDGKHLSKTRIAFGIKDFWEKDLRPECVKNPKGLYKMFNV